MKDELKGKYVPPPFSDRFMDKRHQYTQGNKSVKEHVTKFNEFGKEGQAQTFSKFRTGLREDCKPNY